jgi:diguanylate cyclase (GGDEF)-like protein
VERGGERERILGCRLVGRGLGDGVVGRELLGVGLVGRGLVGHRLLGRRFLGRRILGNGRRELAVGRVIRGAFDNMAMTTTLHAERPGASARQRRPRPRAISARRERPEIKLSPVAAAYFALVGSATALAVTAAAVFGPRTGDWVTFAVLAVAVAVAQLFVVRTPRNQSYQTTIVFLIPAALLLPPALVALLPIVQHVPEWIRARYRWQVPVFNILNYTLDAIAACAAARLVLAGEPAVPGLRWALAGLAAAVVFVGLNHLLLATMIRVVHGHSFRAGGLFSAESLSTDLVLALIGVSLAAFWHWSYWLIPVAIAPLVLIHRSLAVPALQEQVRIDPKTGLFNARYFAEALEDELARAGRFERPLSLIMGDLDLLRDINNTYGHLAGDAVLSGIAQIFREELREYDVPSRFGGEEFAIVLPETSGEDAVAIAERIRRSLAATKFVVSGSEPIRATISLGVACFPRDGRDAKELLKRADEAVYKAKLEGRNRVVAAGSPNPSVIERAARLAG